jgi:RNA polymerase sigma factor (sigma-70 family)
MTACFVPSCRAPLDSNQEVEPPRLADGCPLPGPAGAANSGVSDGELLRRFVARQDPAAFEALVRRHGPMVLGVCRRVLRDAHRAEDAFQATFVVLMHKAPLIGQPERLANWLYGVAARVAGQAKVRAARCWAHERQAVPAPVADPAGEVAWRDLCTVLTAEVNRLPEKYRAPLLLCYWEGKTNGEAARQLGWPAGSISYRLARGREMLRERLTRCAGEALLG